MGENEIIELGTKAILVSLKVSAPVLLSTLLMGLLVSIFQAATQINEQTLSFIPKILAMTVALVFLGPWIMQVMLNFTINLFNQIPTILH